MTIIGNGVDIVENIRIAKSIRNSSFIDRIFAKNEVIQSKKSRNKVNFFTPFTAKFSSHEKSISIIYGSNLLRIGYWLSRICLLEQKIIKDKDTATKIYTYLIVTGIYLLFYNVINLYFFKNIIFELIKITSKTPYNFSFKYFTDIIINRIKK